MEIPFNSIQYFINSFWASVSSLSMKKIKIKMETRFVFMSVRLGYGRC